VNEAMLFCSGVNGIHYCVENPQPASNFSVDSAKGSGRQGRCVVCTSESDRLYESPKRNPFKNAVSKKAKELAKLDGVKVFNEISKEERLKYRELAKTTVSNLSLAKEVLPKEDLPKIQKDPKTKSISVPRETYPKEGYVYIFQDMMKPNGVYKIGSTDDVGGRLSSARTWGEFQCVRWFYSDDCKALEKKTHNELSEFKIKKDGMGDEWFQIAKDTAINKIQELSNAATAV